VTLSCETTGTTDDGGFDLDRFTPSAPGCVRSARARSRYASHPYSETGEQTRKARNLARDPRCTLSVATDVFDLVVEGTAHTVTDRATVAAMGARWSAEGWPVPVDDSGAALTADYSAPSGGPPPWPVYHLTVDQAAALETVEPGGATRSAFARQ
jgi:hypothetical protein